MGKKTATRLGSIEPTFELDSEHDDRASARGNKRTRTTLYGRRSARSDQHHCPGGEPEEQHGERDPDRRAMLLGDRQILAYLRLAVRWVRLERAERDARRTCVRAGEKIRQIVLRCDS